MINSVILNFLSGIAASMSLASILSVLIRVTKQERKKKQFHDIEKLYKQINDQKLELEKMQYEIKLKELKHVDKKKEYEILIRQIDSLLEQYKKEI